jgi:hypothetical protein
MMVTFPSPAQVLSKRTFNMKCRTVLHCMHIDIERHKYSEDKKSSEKN